MSPADLLTHVRRRPFVPFRVVTSDGTTYDVRHPDIVMVTLGSVIIGYPDRRQDGLAERYDLVSLRHIVRLEPEDYPAPSVPTEGTPPREDS
ncbi:MAG: hypothetical protein U0797_11530 [Gemmataceae bacterium]